MHKTDPELHVRGLSRFLDDTPDPSGCLHCVVLFSTAACGTIEKFDITAALKVPGVQAILCDKDIPGDNQIGTIILDEPLFTSKEIHFAGQPIAAVIAETEQIARDARQLIELEIEEKEAVTDPRQAYARGHLIAPSRTFLLGDSEKAFQEADFVVAGQAKTGGQEHFYMEGQGAIAVPRERGKLQILSSTQGPTTVQKVVARVCGLQMHQVEVDVQRLGGGFGGKEDQANAWAAIAALGAQKLQRPVKLLLRRAEDMVVTGKRHPYSSDFRIGINRTGKILAYEASYYQNAGASADLSTAILERSLFHATGSYFIPNVKINAACCKTNLAPFTAFRGFGGPQAMFVMESAIHAVSKASGIPVKTIQQTNLLKDRDQFPYGQRTENCNAENCWDLLAAKLQEEKQPPHETNDSGENRFVRGTAMMPVCFGISFTNTGLNQARALIHVYLDGSVGISTGAVEMGQGVNQKIVDIVYRTFGISENIVSIESTNTTRISNTSPTAASSGSDLNGKAAELACNQILERLFEFLRKNAPLPNTIKDLVRECRKLSFRSGQLYADETPADLTWEKIIDMAYWNRVHLSAEAHFATPEIWFDKTKETGQPFAYHTYGCAHTQVTVDKLLGTYTVDSVDIVHDAGESINPLIDIGQIEGGLAQGIGWMTLEELLYTPQGRLLTGTAGTYKIPDFYSTPQNVRIHFLDNAENPKAVFHSKAVGEPPFMYGIGTYFALLNAIEKIIPDTTVFPERHLYNGPMTPEKLFLLINHATPGE